ncbi:MAG: hypothetical protein J4G13_03880 [Dehalococcoidia bacterium]|nr:hypothetical protein [Dehalococcoidia bacterium]
MLDRISKIATIFAASVAIVVILIGGVAWAVRLDANMRVLQEEVSAMRQDVDEMKGNQRIILDSLERLEAASVNHTHDEDGRVVIPLSKR